mgnify:CR=1 FL=1
MDYGLCYTISDLVPAVIRITTQEYKDDPEKYWKLIDNGEIIQVGEHMTLGIPVIEKEDDQEVVFIVLSGEHSSESSESIESVWSTREAAVKHLAHLGACFKYTQKSDTWWESGTRWIGISEHEVDPEV